MTPSVKLDSPSIPSIVIQPQENSGDGNDNARLLDACQQFEAVLVGQMFSGMHGNSLKSDLLPEGPETEMYNQMLDQEVANAVSHQQGVGLANLLFQQFTGKSPEEAGIEP